MDELKDLLKQERQLILTINGVGDFVEAYKKAEHENQISIRLDTLEEAMRKFFKVRRKIEAMIDDEDEDEVVGESKEARKKRLADLVVQREMEYNKALRDVEERYFVVKARLVALRPVKVEPTPGADLNETCFDRSISRIKLPDIKLPNFSGELKDWIPFRDTYKSLIHSNVQLPDIDKFTYLRSALQGEAQLEILSVDFSAEGYDVAWKALEKKYDNHKLIVKAYLDAIFDIEPLRKESFGGLSHLISEFETNLQMLKKLGEGTEAWSTILVHMLCARLDHATLRLWESHHNSKAVPKYDVLIEFLRDQCTVLQSIKANRPSEGDGRQNRSRISTAHTSSQSQRRCLFCGETFHMPFNCSKLRNMSVSQRVEEVNLRRLCRNCLNAGHYADGCSRGSCSRCGARHHTLLHYDTPAPAGARQGRSSVQNTQNRPPAAGQQQHTRQQGQTQNSSTQPTTSSYPVHQSTSRNTHPPPPTDSRNSTTLNAASLPAQNAPTLSRQVLMSTAVVRVEDQFGNYSLARTLLDSCSEFCYMTSTFSKKLKFRTTPDVLRVQGIGNGSATSLKAVRAKIQPRLDTISSFSEEMRFHLLQKISSDLPATPVDVSQLMLPSDIILADPYFGEPGPIDMIIGAEFFLDLLSAGRRKIVEDGPTLQETVLGWIISGKVPASSPSIPRTATYVSSTVDLKELMERFWELESCHVNSTHSVEESTCEELFNKTTIRDAEGRFVVTLPKKQRVIEKLGESRNMAMKRFIGMEKRFTTNPALKFMYTEFVHEYLLMKHMREVKEDSGEGPVYYLPHHAVLKPDSTTTKLRVVFDGSCGTSSGVSLNDALMVGPVVQSDLLSTVLRFRLHRVALIADVEKMYRQIRVTLSDQRLQRIYWRDNEDEPVKTYELSTVTYGTSSAPYLATRCLKKLGEDCAESHPVASRVIQEDFYVDDMLSGADSIEEASTLMKEVRQVTDSAGFTLRKWNSNCPELLKRLPKHLKDERSTLEIDPAKTTVKTLGLRWEVSTDMFCFVLPQWKSELSPITKRTVHSDSAMLFDPDGFLAPVVVQAKIICQQLWRIKSDWDVPLDESLQQLWRDYRMSFMAVATIKMPRWIGFSTDCVEIQIHGFCDASERAYGAGLYLRCTALDGSVTCRLFLAKSKVAPMENLKRKKKKVNIPRLELSSGLLLSHMYEKVQSILPAAQLFCWTDSMITLGWLASPPSRWKPFVGNRVSEIQHITRNAIWGHVPGEENPADIISRGMSPALLQYRTDFYEAPRWVVQDRENWPRTQRVSLADFDPEILEERVTPAFPTQVRPPHWLFGLCGSYMELVRLVTWLQRSKFNLSPKNRAVRRVGFLKSEELEEAVLFLVRLSQEECFPGEMHCLKADGVVHPTSKIARLNPQLVDGVMRVGGRLSNAKISTNRKHPLILDHHHPFTRLVVMYFHERLFHAGQQLLIASVRSKFWPVNVHSLARQVIHECISCFKSKPKVIEQIMADLPAERVNPAPPFLHVGVDYCGPFLVSYPNRRAKPVKCYVAVFVCLAVKAVHLELVFDLTSQAFIAALRRFVARRGKPLQIKCDNATTFVGAKNDLMELHRLFYKQQFQDVVTKTALEDGIEFSFIPPRSPNFGGLWESQVKSFKTHLKKTFGLQVLKMDEMLTALAQIEAVLNSRPLTPISNDPQDFEALTPGHFLIQRPLTAIAEPDLEGVPQNRLAMWQNAQRFTQQLWKKWSTQYLSNLRSGRRSETTSPLFTHATYTYYIQVLSEAHHQLHRRPKVHPHKTNPQQQHSGDQHTGERHTTSVTPLWPAGPVSSLPGWETCNEININKMAFQRRRRRHQPMHLHPNRVHSVVDSLSHPKQSVFRWSMRPTHTEDSQRKAAPEGQHTASELAKADDAKQRLQRQQKHHHDRYSAATPTRRLQRQHRSSR
ncbi:uncharacterized protein LOC120429503 [Culex pipiens pallens]|uniref:uncharacterized protein LOC120429503 n=1 Tax=Culex pipiens pallens TaxID=42434 RepID=UPI001953FBBE|nr:uncharacterized protein LOC120429503 [Culex pipiens pallens]